MAKKRSGKPADKHTPGRPLGIRTDIIGVALAVLAILTLLSLFSLSQGTLTRGWIMALRLVFGIGVYLVPLGLGAIGLWLVLLNFDERPQIDWERPAGIVLLFFLLLCVAHLIASIGADMQAVADAGNGGGYLGYILTLGLTSALGYAGAWLVLIVLFLLALILLLDITLAEFGRLVALRFGGLFHRRKPAAPAEEGEIWIPPASIVRPAPASEPAPLIVRPAGQRPPVAPGSVSPVPDRFTPTSPPAAVDAGALRVSAGGQSWQLPAISEILEESAEVEVSQPEVRERARIIEETLASFGVPARVVEVNQGPTVTQFGVAPGFLEKKDAEGRTKRSKVKVASISALAKDLALALAASPIRIEAPVPGRSIVGVEVPNAQSTIVSLRSVMESEAFRSMDSPLKIALGQDVSGQAVTADLASMPHLLIAGATGSGKSVCINAIIACLLCTNTPDMLRFLMIDPKRVELVAYNGVPHLLSPVVVDLERVVPTLQWATREMDRRYQLFAKAGVRNLEGYNKRQATLSEPPLPMIVIIIDELADLMMAAQEEVERLICRIAQMARATGIHLIIATQRPSVDVVTGLIKANFPARISFAVSTQIDSRVILDSAGAEQLLGRGDMLFMSPDSAKLRRLQGCYVSDQEMYRLVRYWKGIRTAAEPAQAISAPAAEDVVQPPLWADMTAQGRSAPPKDDLFDEAVRVIQAHDRASISLLQRRLRIGYSRAARLIDLLEQKGYVGPEESASRSRQVLIKGEQAGSDGGRGLSPA
jgi:S-DNA-T family DNA segregation ATPase FtsK/SpoIIIE